MIELFKVGFQTEEQVSKWLDGDDFSYIIYYNEVANKHFDDLDGNVNNRVDKKQAVMVCFFILFLVDKLELVWYNLV